MKIVESNMGIRSINLSANNLKDRFVESVILALKHNTDILVLKLHNNFVDSRRIVCVETLLEKNRELCRKRKLPYYEMLINKFKIVPGEFIKTVHQISKVSEECARMQVATGVHESALKHTEVSELNQTKVYEDLKEKVDAQLEEITNQVDEVDSAIAQTVTLNDREIKKMNSKIRGVERQSDQIDNECIKRCMKHNSN